MKKFQSKADGSPFNARPNLLNFANNVLLSKNKRGSYNINTGEQNPDTGYLVTVVFETERVIDRDTVRDFWKKHSTALAQADTWLTVEQTLSGWRYQIDKFYKKIPKSAFISTVYDNTKQEWI